MEGATMRFADEDLWLMWLAWQWKFRAYSTIRSMIFAIKHHYSMLFGFDPFKSNGQGHRVEYLRFQRGLRQVKRSSMSKARPPKMSLTKFLLLEIEPYFDFARYEDCLYWAILVIGVSCLLRWSEICKTTGEAKILMKHSLKKLRNSSYQLELKDTKTKLFGDEMLVSFSADGTKVCPVAAWRRLKAFPGFRSRQFLFASKKGKPVRAKDVQEFLKGKLIAAGHDSAEWASGISMRKGGALTMALCGVPDRVIRAYGRWKSYAYRIYIDLTMREKQQWAGVIKGCLKNQNRMVRTQSQVSMAALMDD